MSGLDGIKRATCQSCGSQHISLELEARNLSAIQLRRFAQAMHDHVPNDDARIALAGQLSDAMTPDDGADFRELCE
jgi:hypothetical protein